MNKPIECELIAKAKFILPMDAELKIIENGALAVDGGKILGIGVETEIEKKYHAWEIFNAGNSIILPGLINAHTHAAMAYFRGLADDLALDDWLKNHIWPAEAKWVDSGFIKKSCELACLEMIKAGTTCFNDMYFFLDSAAEAVKAAGLRAVLGEVILNFPTPSAGSWRETIKRTEDFAFRFKDDESINVSADPHAVYTCSREAFNAAKELSDKFGLLLHIHLSETKKEVEDWRKKTGKTPVEYLDEIGFLGEKVTAAHAIWLSENDLEILAKRKVKIAHNPISNMKLASGVMPASKMMKRLIAVGLGTDGAASNNTLDLFSDMRISALLHKVSDFEPTAVSAREALSMATRVGAEAVGREKEIGSLEAGKKADFISVGLDRPHLAPIYDPFSHLVYCANAGDVDYVFVDGKAIMKNRTAIGLDEEKILREAKEFKI